ncbi:hypothetical protein KGF56_000973 [Candida oxycetoniae]|uniref:WSC domain-containing protein n=1 Tax=Candida oxycetoniae TaxID=497107 RepID=A0AAI9WZ78_9ASCO|nr:uncharacterized protein KGF56_000973 [Candida oxycetoniae]KAI3406131.2 hypothetical protein KGF56_000973 [Candida oxycetoniae]
MFSRLIPLILSLISLANAADVYYPAAQLVGCYSGVGDSEADSQGDYQWQSSGYCSNHLCPDSQYVAIKGEECICLNSLPSSSNKQSDDSKCNIPCPGYNKEMCGGSSFYSIFFGVNNSGNNGGGGSSSGSSSSDDSDSSTSSSSSAGSLSSSASGSSSSPSSNQQSTITNVVTSSNDAGEVVIRTITQTSSGDASNTEATPASETSSSEGDAEATNGNENKSKSSVGSIVGGVVGGVAGAVVIAGLLFFFIRRRNRGYDDNDYDEGYSHDEEKYYSNDKLQNFFAMSRSNGSTRDKNSNRNSNRNNNNNNNNNNNGASPLDMPMSNPFQHPADNTANQNSTERTTTNGATLGLADPRINLASVGRRRLSEGSLVDEAIYSQGKFLQVINPDERRSQIL